MGVLNIDKGFRSPGVDLWGYAYDDRPVEFNLRSGEAVWSWVDDGALLDHLRKTHAPAYEEALARNSMVNLMATCLVITVSLWMATILYGLVRAKTAS